MNKLDINTIKGVIGIVCAILSAILALKGVDGWGWFLFVSILIWG